LLGTERYKYSPPPTSAVVTAEVSISYEYSRTFAIDMVANTDLHIMPVQIEPILLDLAEALAWAYLRQPQMSQLAWTRALTTIQLYVPDSEFFARVALNLEPTDLNEKIRR